MYRLIIWKCSNSETLRVQIFSQKTTFKHFCWPTAAFSLFCFFLPSGSWPSMISATLSALPALPFTFHADMLGIPTPPPSPQNNVVSWLDDFAHAVIQLLNGYLLNYLSVRLLAILSRTSASSPTPMVLLPCNSYTSFKKQSWRHIL